MEATLAKQLYAGSRGRPAENFVLMDTYTHTHTHAQSFYCSSGICPGLPGWASTRKVKNRKVRPIWIYWSKR